jgi:hypothetical protein
MMRYCRNVCWIELQAGFIRRLLEAAIPHGLRGGWCSLDIRAGTTTVERLSHRSRNHVLCCGVTIHIFGGESGVRAPIGASC